ncbi:ferric uptake regulator, Fur family [Syntrophobotulus glycolicus DSM 8271]|uniref:Ferric uptake regulator, Fur family n=1 Tax=Syntrophobotulus glycolicus (strain DSM 8271 / FlGlyR) TaxID=645991 RepID=F0SVQ2_SYNGF|nr:transcriptional repressor [Syntrophobotulus glycolicus]ADY54528.1 ferric uptake regulator, Fur family [Syntrophobotulus glycolicus DSM 8271]
MKTVQTNWPAGLKRTRQRESVLTVLELSEKPLSASDICSAMEKNGDAAWLSTVYRILELFIKKGLVIKTTVINNEMAVYELNRFKHQHYAVCINCHKMIPMADCPMEKFIPKLEDEDFQVMGHNLEVFGFCRDCHPN